MPRRSSQTLTTTESASGNAAPPTGCHARAFSGGASPTVELQAHVRFRDDHERTRLSSAASPRRAMQIMDSVLRLRSFEGVEQRQLRVDIHREDAGRWCHHYGLAVAVAMISSIARRPIPVQHLFAGDVDLNGHIRDVAPGVVDALNEAIEAFAIETPVTVVLAADSATWMQSSSTVRVIAARTLSDVAAAVWPNTNLTPQ